MDVSQNSIEESDYTINEDYHESIDASLPRKGMEFPNSELTYEFYKTFALKQGFATRKYSSTNFHEKVFRVLLIMYYESSLVKFDNHKRIHIITLPIDCQM